MTHRQTNYPKTDCVLHTRRASAVALWFVLFFTTVTQGQNIQSTFRDPDQARAQRLLAPVSFAPAGVRWCKYPSHAVSAPGAALNRFNNLIPATDTEPNDIVAQAQAIPLGFGGGQDTEVIVTGSLSSNADVDMFKVSLHKGDIIGLACHCSGATDSVVTVRDSVGTAFFSNDNHGGLNSLYPPGVPWPLGLSGFDSALTFVVPSDGDYILDVTRATPGAIGPYSLDVILHRPSIETTFPTPIHQIIFLDFNGATINAFALFGEGRAVATLSPLSAFLTRWGLTLADESAVIDAILLNVNQRFNALRTGGLNGDFPNDMMPGHFDVEIRNSRDNPDPFGAPNVSRVIVGGTIAQSGISTIGIASAVDPGNFSTTDTAICLLDLLSAASSDPNSVLSIPRAGGVTVIDAIGIIVGNVVSHEAGHFLGNWHTRNDDGITCLMDAGGDLSNLAGVGVDGILGTGDDVVSSFRSDQFDVGEGIGTGQEKTDVVTAFGLSTGTLAADVTPPMVTTRNPAPGAFVANTNSVSVIFDETVIDVDGADLTINGSAATSVSGSGAGPYLFSGAATPAAGTVTIILGAGGGITDLSGNPLAQVSWTVDVHDCNNNGVADSLDIISLASKDCPPNGIPDECEPGSLNVQPGATQTITVGQTVVVNAAAATGGTLPYQFLWTLTGGGTMVTSTSATPTFTPQTAGEYVLTLSVTDGVSCTATGTLNVHVDATVVAGGGGDNLTGGGGGTPSTPVSPACGSLCGTGAAGSLLWMIFGAIGIGGLRWRRRRAEARWKA